MAVNKRSQIAYYQEIMIYKCFERFDYPVNEICTEMKGIITLCDTQDKLLKAIIAGGSLAFNAIVNILKKNDDPILAAALENHNIAEKYRWVWLSSWNGAILNRSNILHESLHQCKVTATDNRPCFNSSVNTELDTILGIESVCSCYEHLSPGQDLPREPCLCFQESDAETITAVQINARGSVLMYLPSLKD
jgi:hypothetical protein